MIFIAETLWTISAMLFLIVTKQNGHAIVWGLCMGENNDIYKMEREAYTV